MANNPNAGPAAALPPWFGRRTVLEAVERLVVNDNINAERGWTRAQIRESLLQAHPQNPGEEELPQGFDAALGTALSGLLDGDYLVTGVNQQHYMLHTAVPHHLPLWFGKDAVLHAVGLLDGINGNNDGSTWSRIRDLLMDIHQQERLLLPPGFDQLLRKMLSVLRKRRHLTRGARSRQHYTCLPAPALADADPNHIPMGEFQLGYYLGYKKGGHDGFGYGEFEGVMMGLDD